MKEEFKGKTAYSITDLYRLVVPPLYEPPEYDTPDFLITGIVASKSPVRQLKNREDGGNYLVIKLTDLKVFPLAKVPPLIVIDGYRFIFIWSCVYRNMESTKGNGNSIIKSLDIQKERWKRI